MHDKKAAFRGGFCFASGLVNDRRWCKKASYIVKWNRLVFVGFDHLRGCIEINSHLLYIKHNVEKMKTFKYGLSD